MPQEFQEPTNIEEKSDIPQITRGANPEIEKSLEEFESLISQKKHIDVETLTKAFENLRETIEKYKNEAEEAIIRTSYLVERVRDTHPLRFSILKNLFEKTFNGKLPENLKEEIIKEKETEAERELKSDILWDEIMEASRQIDKLTGRRLGKKLRRKIKKGLNIEDIIEDKKIKKELEIKEVSIDDLKSALQEYESRYKGWRTFIEEEAENTIKELEEKEEIEKTKNQLETFWREGVISEDTLETIASDTPEGKLINALFGGDYDKEAAKLLLEEIETGKVISPVVEESIRKRNPFYREWKEKFQAHKVSLREIQEKAREQKADPKLAPGSRWAQVLLKDIRREQRKRAKK